MICLANSQTKINKKYAPTNIQEIVIRTDQLKEKLEQWYTNDGYPVKFKPKQIEQLVELINSKLIEHEIDYVHKLNLHLMETKKVEKETQISETKVLKEIVEEVVPVEQNDELFDALKEYRTNKAKELKYPPYYIFNNDELANLILKNPLTIEELKIYHILEDIKFKMYGEDIIEIIRLYSKKEIEEKENRDNSFVYQKLKAYRFAKSQQLNWKPYQVFTNEMLNDLVEQLPETKEQLDSISGFSEKKIEMFGDEILRIIKINK